MTTRHRSAPATDPHAHAAHDSWELRLLAALGTARERAELERRIARAAVHPEALGGEVAYLLRWDSLTDLFALGERVGRADLAGDLAAALEEGPATGPAPPEGEAGRDPATLAWELDSLDGVTRKAWQEVAHGAGAPEAPELPWGRARRIAAVPLRSGPLPTGLLIVECGEDRIASRRLARFAAVVRFVLESRARAEQLEERTLQAGALLELAQSAVSPRNVAEVLHLAARLAAERTAMDGAVVWTAEPDGTLALRVTHGPAGMRERIGRALHAVAAAAIEEQKPRVATPAMDEFLVPPAAVAELSALAMWPIVAYGRALGAIGVWRGHGDLASRPLDRAEREFLAHAASVLGGTLDHAQRFTELREAERREQDAARWARSREPLAALGELAARASLESAKSVASIRAFASRMTRSLAEGDAGREYAEVILREAERLERILREQRAHAELTPPRLERVDLNALAERALRDAGETLVRRRARVVKKLAAELPQLLLDPRGIEHVLHALVAFALDSIAIGGRIRIETRRLPHHVLFELAHDGAHRTGESLDPLFLPFAAVPGTTGGLGLAPKVIHDHGGEIRVRAEGEWTTIMSFTLPILGNQDRRRVPADRRRSQDRRTGPAAA